MFKVGCESGIRVIGDALPSIHQARILSFAFVGAEIIHWSSLNFWFITKLNDPEYFFFFRSFVRMSTRTWILYPFSQSRVRYLWMLMLWIFSSMDPPQSLRTKTGKRVTQICYPLCWKKVSSHAVRKHQSFSIWTVLFLLVNLILKFPHVKLLAYNKVVNFV